MEAFFWILGILVVTIAFFSDLFQIAQMNSYVFGLVLAGAALSVLFAAYLRQRRLSPSDIFARDQLCAYPLPSGERGKVLIKEIWSLELSEYNDESVGYDGLLSWWEKYPSGIYGLFEPPRRSKQPLLVRALGRWRTSQQACERVLLTLRKKYPNGVCGFFKPPSRPSGQPRLVGAIGLWPITQHAYNDIVAGTLSETKLMSDDILDCIDSDKPTYWYFGDVILNKDYRRHKRKK